VVLIGADATKPFVHGGGSGSVEPTYTVSPLSAIRQRNGGTVPKSGPGGGGPGLPVNCTVTDRDTDFFTVGGSSEIHPQDNSVAGCCKACGNEAGSFSYFTATDNNGCWCHKKQGMKRKHTGYTSGSCHATAPPGPPPTSTGVTVATGAGAAAAAAAADVAVVFIHTTSSEGSDRKSLSFAAADDAMVCYAVEQVISYEGIVYERPPDPYHKPAPSVGRGGRQGPEEHRRRDGQPGRRPHAVERRRRRRAHDVHARPRGADDDGVL
jgi:hypothetical protein